MIINRNIGRINIDIDIEEGCGVFFDEELAMKLKYDNMSDILELIYEENEVTHMPLSLFIELTNSCNFNCKFCYVNENNQSKYIVPSFLELKPILDFCIENGLLYCTLSGGECLTYKDFGMLYKYLKENGVLVSIFTNGYLIDETLINLLKKYKPFRLEISIYGIDNRSYKNTVGIEVDSEKVFSIIKLLKDNDINIICKTPITSFTEDIYLDVENWCLENNIPFYTGIELIDGYSGESKQMYKASEQVLKYEMNKEKNKYLDVSRELGISDYKIKYNFDCTAGKTDVFINSKLELLPCMKAVNRDDWKFNIKELGIDKAYQLLVDKIKLEKKYMIKGCKGCIHSNVCEKCYFSQFEDSQEQVDEYCKRLNQFYNDLR